MAAAAMLAVGVVLNGGAFLLILRAFARSATRLGPWSATLVLPAAFAGAFLFCVAYAWLARGHGIRIALRSWYDGHRDQVAAALDAVVRRLDAAPAGGARKLSSAGWRRASTVLSGTPRPLRMIVRWALRRVGVGGIAGLLEEGDGAPSARLDALIRGDLLNVSTRPFWILFGVNVATVAAALLWIA